MADEIWKGMPRAAHAKIQAYIDDLRPLVELRDWKVELQEHPAPEDSLASITCTYGRKYACVKVCDDFLTHEPAEQRQALAHELVHIHLDAAWTVVRETLAATIGPRAVNDLWEAYKLHLEFGVDALADALAPHLPLPELAEKS